MRRFSIKRTAVAAAALMTLAGQAHAEWLRAETDHFVIYGDTSRGAIRNEARKLERCDALLRTYYPIEIDHEIPKLEIYLAEGQADMRRASPGISPSIGGFYSPTGGRIHAVANTESPMADDVLFHEYGHHFMFQMASSAYPAWFVEGFAEYYATVEIRDDRFQIGRLNEGRMRSLAGPYNTWPPLEDVLRWRVTQSGRFRSGAYYALSWALTHYFLSDPDRTPQLRAYLAAVAAGAEPVAAMEAAVGQSAEDLRYALRRYITGPLIYLTPQIPVPDPEVQISTLGPDEARLVWLDLRLDRMSPREREPTLTRRTGEADEAYDRRLATERTRVREQRADLVRETLAAVAANPSAPSSLRAKARAERISGDAPAALATLEPLLDQDSQDARALRLAAEILLDQAVGTNSSGAAGVRQARSYLARAIEIDPLDFQIYVALDWSRSGASDYPSPNDLATLEVANALAPQSFDVRLRYARALMAGDRNPEAIAILGPVANSPHAAPARAQARRMLAQARAASGRAAEAEGEAPPEEDPGEDQAAMRAD